MTYLVIEIRSLICEKLYFEKKKKKLENFMIFRSPFWPIPMSVYLASLCIKIKSSR